MAATYIEKLLQRLPGHAQQLLHSYTIGLEEGQEGAASKQGGTGRRLGCMLNKALPGNQQSRR